MAFEWSDCINMGRVHSIRDRALNEIQQMPGSDMARDLVWMADELMRMRVLHGFANAAWQRLGDELAELKAKLAAQE